MDTKQARNRYSINGKFFNFQEDEECIDYLFSAGYTLYENTENHDIITYCKEFDDLLNIKNDYSKCKELKRDCDECKKPRVEVIDCKEWGK